MANRKKVAGGLVIILLSCALLCCVMAHIPQRVTAWAQTVTSAWTFYNDRANANETHQDDFSFDRNTSDDNTYLDGENAVKAGQANSVLEYHIRYDENTGEFVGELPKRENPATEAADPVLLASHCLHMEETTGMLILVDEQDIAPVNRGEAAVDHFMADREYAQECYERLTDAYSHATSIEVRWVDDYKNSHYEQPKGSHGARPALRVWESTNSGGHMIVFHFGDKVGDVMYRIECGYQPINVDYIPTPDTPPVPDNPEPPTPPTPTPPTPPTPDEPEPKDPTQDYQYRHPDDPDVGGGQTHDSDDTVTDEPTPEKDSPDEYRAPDKPKADDSSSGGNSTPAGKDEASRGTQSGSKTADQDNGKTESYKDPDTGKQESGTVTAGDGKDHGDHAQHVDEHPATVEPGAGDDNGEFAPPE